MQDEYFFKISDLKKRENPDNADYHLNIVQSSSLLGEMNIIEVGKVLNGIKILN
jgi:hypothetical protein